jgi:hypothetical protein
MTPPIPLEERERLRDVEKCAFRFLIDAVPRLLDALEQAERERDTNRTIAENASALVGRIAHGVGLGNGPTEPEIISRVEALVEARDANWEALERVTWERDALTRQIAEVEAPPVKESLTTAPSADENGECLNCANPPHSGPCRRRQAPPPEPKCATCAGSRAIRNKDPFGPYSVACPDCAVKP